jgi:hypothetical protein
MAVDITKKSYKIFIGESTVDGEPGFVSIYDSITNNS